MMLAGEPCGGLLRWEAGLFVQDRRTGGELRLGAAARDAQGDGEGQVWPVRDSGAGGPRSGVEPGALFEAGEGQVALVGVAGGEGRGAAWAPAAGDQRDPRPLGRFRQGE
ncbi:hypothetical protein IQ62_20305 [Streptomyces scabiei]|nr:hypothetical protein IQ62_20305 [Streptomyces scabiei]